jgi:hypothetical protein
MPEAFLKEKDERRRKARWAVSCSLEKLLVDEFIMRNLKHQL